MSRGRFDQTRNTIVPGEGMNFKWVDVEKEEEEEEEDSIVISGLVQRIYRKSLKKKKEENEGVFGRVEKPLGG